MKTVRTKTIKRKNTATRNLGLVRGKRSRKVAKKAASAPESRPPQPLMPPYDLSDAEVSEILASYRFKTAEDETERCTTLLQELADELESIAEGVMHTINDQQHGDRQTSRWMADSLLAYSRSLGDITARLARYSGMFAAYRDAEHRATNAEDMVEAFRDGSLGKPKPDIQVGRAGRLLREARVTP